MDRTNCKFCLEEVYAEAKKCPHCHSMLNITKKKMFQNFQPAIVLGLIFISLFGFIILMEQKENVEDLVKVELLEIVETKLHKLQSVDEPLVVITGKIINSSKKSFHEIYFHVDHFDSAGNMIDTYSDFNYDLYINPESNTSFRIVSTAAREFDLYKDHKVTIKHVETIR